MNYTLNAVLVAEIRKRAEVVFTSGLHETTMGHTELGTALAAEAQTLKDLADILAKLPLTGEKL